MLLGFHLYPAYPEANRNSYENICAYIPLISGGKKGAVWVMYFTTVISGHVAEFGK
jgi:hypothetical protein